MNDPAPLVVGNNWVVMVTALAVTGGLIAQIVLQVLARTEAKRAAEQAKADALKAQAAADSAAHEAKQATRAVAATSMDMGIKLDGIAMVADKTHTLVNSNMGQQLHLNALVSRRLADLTRDPTDVAAAELAERLYNEHQSKQAVVDSGGKTG